MDDRSGFDWRAFLWAILKPALIALILMALTALGVTNLAARLTGSQDVGIASGTHFSGPVIVAGGLQTGNNLTMTVGGLINSKGAVTVTDQLHVSGNVNVAGGYLTVTNLVSTTANLYVTGDLDIGGNLVSGSGSARINDNLLVTGTVGTTSLVTYGNGLTGAGGFTMTTGALLNANGAVTVSDQLNVSSLLTGANGIAAAGGITSTGNVTATAMVQVGTWGLYQRQTPIAVINMTYITPTGTYQPLSLAANCGTSNLAAMPAGYLLMLVNESNFTVSITDTATIMLSASWSGSQYDTLTLLSDGTNWLELARSVN
jgi:cytoskeletal protein CcmA (bactofilin family)